MTDKPTDPKWKCSQCGSTNVQVSFPAWHYEGRNGAITYIETDDGAEIQWWYCEDCSESDSGQPDRVMS